jgi:hypothetical protein
MAATVRTEFGQEFRNELLGFLGSGGDIKDLVERMVKKTALHIAHSDPTYALANVDQINKAAKALVFGMVFCAVYSKEEAEAKFNEWWESM